MIKFIKDIINRIRHPEKYVSYPAGNLYLITIVSGKGYGQSRMAEVMAPWDENPDEQSRCVLSAVLDEPLTVGDIRNICNNLEGTEVDMH